jgi:hypothetical protein
MISSSIIAVEGVSCELLLHNYLLMEKSAQSIVILIHDQRVSTSTQMQLTTAHMIAGEKADESSPFH